MKQDVSSHETVNELAKKVLELYDVIDKQNDYIKKYQIALEMASVDVEECDVCPERAYCQEHRHDTIRLDCGEILLESWKEKAGLV